MQDQSGGGCLFQRQSGTEGGQRNQGRRGAKDEAKKREKLSGHGAIFLQRFRDVLRHN